MLKILNPLSCSNSIIYKSNVITIPLASNLYSLQFFTDDTINIQFTLHIIPLSSIISATQFTIPLKIHKTAHYIE